MNGQFTNKILGWYLDKRNCKTKMAEVGHGRKPVNLTKIIDNILCHMIKYLLGTLTKKIYKTTRKNTWLVP